MQIQPILAFTDNYIWMFTDPENRHACIVDPGDAAPVIAVLEARKLELATILLTHHHQDHTGGVRALLDRYSEVSVYGPYSDKISTVTMPLLNNATIEVFGRSFTVITVPGHTLDHIAYYSTSVGIDEPGVLFCGDTLFAAGCGRLFEGDPQTMYESLQKLAALPESTLVFCAHEYTLANLGFAHAVEPRNEDILRRIEQSGSARDNRMPTLPSNMGLELRTNPFLRCHNKVVRASASSHRGISNDSEVGIFAALRQWKDNFKA